MIAFLYNSLLLEKGKNTIHNTHRTSQFQFRSCEFRLERHPTRASVLQIFN